MPPSQFKVYFTYLSHQSLKQWNAVETPLMSLKRSRQTNVMRYNVSRTVDSVNGAVLPTRHKPFCLIIDIRSWAVWVKREASVCPAVCSQQAPARPAAESKGCSCEVAVMRSDRGFPKLRGTQTADTFHLVLSWGTATLPIFFSSGSLLRIINQGLQCTGSRV